MPVRLITDETEYRNPDRLWDAYNVDKMYHAGVQVRFDAHQGINHEKARDALRAPACRSSARRTGRRRPTDSQREHNYFTTKPWMFNWLTDQFERKWNNATGHAETKAFVPLPPGRAGLHRCRRTAPPASPTSGVALTWYGGLWAHIYDIYFGTTPNPPLLDRQPAARARASSATDYRTYALPALQPGTTYYWKIVSKTMAFVPNDGPVWSFTTAGTSGGGGTLPAPWTDADVGDVGVAGSASLYRADIHGERRGSGRVGHGRRPQLRVSAAVRRRLDCRAGRHGTERRSLDEGRRDDSRIAQRRIGAGLHARLERKGSGLPAAPHRWWRQSQHAGKPVGGASMGEADASGEHHHGVRVGGRNNAWTQIASNTFSMPASVLVGLGVSSHVRGVNAAATFDNVSVTTGGGQTASLPAGWDHRDIGAVNAPGTATYAAPVFTLAARGADIWGVADAFHYAYKPLQGNATVITRVPTVSFANAWSKAGLMVRETLDAAASHATILVSAGKGVAFQRREATGSQSVSTAGSLSGPPRWLKLVRSGDTFTASESANGTAWTQVGTTTIPMASSVFVGLAVTSHTTTASTTATFDNVTIE